MLKRGCATSCSTVPRATGWRRGARRAVPSCCLTPREMRLPAGAHQEARKRPRVSHVVPRSVLCLQRRSVTVGVGSVVHARAMGDGGGRRRGAEAVESKTSDSLRRRRGRKQRTARHTTTVSCRPPNDGAEEQTTVDNDDDAHSAQEEECIRACRFFLLLLLPRVPLVGAARRRLMCGSAAVRGVRLSSRPLPLCATAQSPPPRGPEDRKKRTKRARERRKKAWTTGRTGALRHGPHARTGRQRTERGRLVLPGAQCCTLSDSSTTTTRSGWLAVAAA